MSRFGHTTEFKKEFLKSLNGILGKKITQEDWGYIALAIAIAKADKDRRTHDRANRKDALAQLKAMLRLKDNDALLQALRGCDRMTLEAIQQAQTDAISDVLWRDGVFVDPDGLEYRHPPTIDHIGPMEQMPPYLPMGIDGVRNAIVAALKSIEADEIHEDSDPLLHLTTQRSRFYPKVGAGNAEKLYQIGLADACWILWRQYASSKGRMAWRTSGTNKRSKLVDFAAAVFSAAGMPLDSSRLVAILKKSK